MGTIESTARKQNRSSNSKSIKSSLLYASRPTSTNTKNESSKTSNSNSTKDINANDISNSSTRKSDPKYVPQSATTNANTSNSRSTMKSSTMYVSPSATTYTKSEADESGKTTWSPLMDGINIIRNGKRIKDLDAHINRVLYGSSKPTRRRLPVFEEICPDESP